MWASREEARTSRERTDKLGSSPHLGQVMDATEGVHHLARWCGHDWLGASSARTAVLEGAPHCNRSSLSSAPRYERDWGQSWIPLSFPRAASPQLCRGTKSGCGTVFRRGARRTFSRTRPRSGAHEAGSYFRNLKSTRRELQSCNRYNTRTWIHG